VTSFNPPLTYLYITSDLGVNIDGGKYKQTWNTTIIVLADQEKCTRLFALNARKTAKYLSSPQKASLFIAKNVTLRRIQDQTDTNSSQ